MRRIDQWTPFAKAAFTMIAISAAIVFARPCPAADEPPLEEPPKDDICAACMDGDAATVQKLLDDKPDRLKMRGSDNMTLLHLAAMAADGKATAELLLARGADVNAKDRKGRTPLRLAVEYDRDVGDLLRQRGGVVAGQGSIFDLALAGDLEQVKKQVEQKAGTLNSRDAFGWTPLHWAVSGRQKDLADFLLGKGAKANVSDRFGVAPLHRAVLVGGKEMAAALIAAGAKLESKTGEGCTPLHSATLWGKTDMVEFLIEKGARIETSDTLGHTAFFNAIIHGQLKTAEVLAAKGANVNMRDMDACTALHLVAKYGFKDRVELLIAKGADLSPTDILGRTPLQYAAEAKKDEIVELLKKHGAR